MKNTVVIGFLGVQLDSGRGNGRWERWRPTISLAMQEDLQIDRFELLVDNRRFGTLAQQVIQDIYVHSPQTTVQIHDFHLPDPWDFEQVYARMHDWLREYPIDTEADDYLVHITTGTHVAQICWFLLTEARFLPARLLQSSPPVKQQSGAPGSYSIIDLNLARYDQIAQRFAKTQAADTSILKSGISTTSPAFNRMISEIEHVAVRSTAPMLLMGPTGAGKSMLARNIYAVKRARQGLKGKFVEINCATLRGDGAASALFGHVRGAFTGAQASRTGLLRSADGGLLFLDEIGELGLDEQAMLLRAIEDKRFLPVGSDQDVTSDFQLLAGTNRDLGTAVRMGSFRDDLYARLNLWTFYLPSLAERREDIAPNLDYELDRFARNQGERVEFNREAKKRFLQFATDPAALWTGNFRDLSAAITRMATLSDSGRITEPVVAAEIGRLQRLWGQSSRTNEELPEVLHALWPQLDRFDQAQLLDVYRVCVQSDSLSAAGRQLFDVSRQSKQSSNDADRLRKYLARFGLQFSDLRR